MLCLLGWQVIPALASLQAGWLLGTQTPVVVCLDALALAHHQAPIKQKKMLVASPALPPAQMQASVLLGFRHPFCSSVSSNEPVTCPGAISAPAGLPGPPIWGCSPSVSNHEGCACALCIPAGLQPSSSHQEVCSHRFRRCVSGLDKERVLVHCGLRAVQRWEMPAAVCIVRRSAAQSHVPTCSTACCVVLLCCSSDMPSSRSSMGISAQP